MERATLGELKTGDEARCAFCKIVRGEGESHAVFDDDVALAFLDRRPLLKGHCLLVPKQHLETLDDLPAESIGSLFARVQVLARAVQRALAADGHFVSINTRISQSVPHLHVHVVPRWKDDKLFSPKLIWRRRPYKDEAEMAQVRDAIREAVGEVQSEGR
jgi:histidine triad (HIT) family protein